MTKPREQEWIFDPFNKVVWMKDGNGEAVDVNFSVPGNGELSAAAPDMARALYAVYGSLTVNEHGGVEVYLTHGKWNALCDALRKVGIIP